MDEEEEQQEEEEVRGGGGMWRSITTIEFITSLHAPHDKPAREEKRGEGEQEREVEGEKRKKNSYRFNHLALLQA